MFLQPEQEERIRRYLLGVATPDEAERVETDLLRGEENVERLSLIEDELITDYALGALPGHEMEALAKNFFITPGRRERLIIAREMIKAASAMSEAMAVEAMNADDTTERINETGAKVGRERLRAMFRPAWVGWKTAIYAAVIIGLGLGVWLWTRGESDVRKGLAAMNQAYHKRRPLEARITGLDYADFRITLGDKETEPDYRNLDEAEMWLRKAAKERADAESLHAIGQFYLAKKDFGKAVDYFTEALKADPDKARFHADLGTALLEKGKTITQAPNVNGDVEEFAEALEHFNKALSLDPDLLEAIFNRALLYEAMMLPQARDEWRRYRERDSTSPWAAEAKQHLDRLEENRKNISQTRKELIEDFLQAYRIGDDEQAWRILSRNGDQIGSVTAQEILDLYLGASLNLRSDEAERYLQALDYAGGVEIKKAGDHFVSDLASFYKTASLPRRKVLLDARSLIKSGSSHLNKGNIEFATGDFEKARRVFQQEGDICESLLAEYLGALGYAADYKAEAGSLIFERLSQRCRQAHYKWLLTRSLIRLVTYEFNHQDYSAVIEQSGRALKVAEEINDADSCAQLLIQRAEAYYYLGNHRTALRLYYQNVLTANQRPLDMPAKWSAYISMALPLNSLNLHTAAAEYQREALRLAIESERPRLIGRSHISLAETYGILRRYDEADANMRLAFEQARKIVSAPHRTELLAYASLKMGSLRRLTGNFAGAIESYDDAIRLFTQVDSPALDYIARKGRLLSFIAQGNLEPVEEEIGRILEMFEEYRSKIREESDRNSFFDAEQSVYDIAIDHWHSRKGDDLAAFNLSERSRARSLLDLTGSSPQDTPNSSGPEPQRNQVSPPMSLAEIRARMPEQAQILQYSVLEDKLLIWLITKGEPVCKEQTISGAELKDQVMSYLQLVTEGPTADRRLIAERARKLHSLLIQPVETLLDKHKLLCLTPDKFLSLIPYAALVSPDSSRLLIEDYSIVFSPSSTMFVICSEVASQKENVGSEKLLVVADPTFDRERFSSLPYLQSARRQAKAFNALYQKPVSLIGEDATKARLISELERFDVLHFALHCVVNERSPMNSQLLLAKPDMSAATADESNGVLQAREIYQLRLSRLRLVVLAACRSGVESYYSGEGMIGVSRPFIARRIPLVVASLWEVDSEATADLMIKFHEYRRLRQLPTTEALRQAQLSMLRDSGDARRSPYFWAAFVSIGGYAKF